jgi:predicted metal-binding protein
MHDDYESRPSYLLVGLMAASELRELLDEMYLYALDHKGNRRGLAL